MEPDERAEPLPVDPSDAGAPGAGDESAHQVVDLTLPADAGPDGAAAAATADALDELQVLAAIEDDFAAVEAAMAGLDRIDSREVGGVAAAAQVEAIVGSGRFDVAG